MDETPSALETVDPPDFSDFSKSLDYYLPRVLGFAVRRTGDSNAAERLTDAILSAALGAGSRLVPGRETDAAILNAARSVVARFAPARH